MTEAIYFLIGLFIGMCFYFAERIRRKEAESKIKTAEKEIEEWKEMFFKEWDEHEPAKFEFDLPKKGTAMHLNPAWANDTIIMNVPRELALNHPLITVTPITLKQKRLALKLSYTQAARGCKLSRATIRRAEKGLASKKSTDKIIKYYDKLEKK